MDKKIKKRWEKIDLEIEKFLKTFKYDIKTRIMAILKKYGISNKTLYNYLSKSDLTMFRVELQDNLDDDMSEYLKYRINQYLKRTKIKYYEALLILIEIAYFKMMNKSKKFEDELFTATAKITSEIVQEESYDVRKPRHPFIYIPIPLYLLPHIMSTPLYLGYNWLEYKQNMIDYNANKTYRKIFVDIQQNKLDLDTYDNSFNIEFKRYKNALDHEIASVNSEISLWAMKEQGITKVQYIATMDERTTEICKSMNGQVFSIYEKNTYYRYADNDDKKQTKYTTYGLVIGENQPALHYNCRSILVPYM